MKKEVGKLCIKECKEFEICKNLKFLFFLILIFILLININFISAQKYTLKVTEEHPFYIVSSLLGVVDGATDDKQLTTNQNEEWVLAKDLNVGDSLITDDGKKAEITNIKEVNEDVEVYNLEANPFNDFIVLGDVVVHNSNKPDKLPNLRKYVQGMKDKTSIEEKINYFNNKIRSLSSEAKQAIIDAHNVLYNKDAPLWERANSLWKKAELLRKAGFSEEEIFFLFETGTCGPEGARSSEYSHTVGTVITIINKMDAKYLSAEKEIVSGDWVNFASAVEDRSISIDSFTYSGDGWREGNALFCLLWHEKTPASMDSLLWIYIHNYPALGWFFLRYVPREILLRRDSKGRLGPFRFALDESYYDAPELTDPPDKKIQLKKQVKFMREYLNLCPEP